MTRNDRGAHHISLIVFDETGHTQALYHKHFLFETETYVLSSLLRQLRADHAMPSRVRMFRPLFTPGSWHPTVVTIAGRTCALCSVLRVCSAHLAEWGWYNRLGLIVCWELYRIPLTDDDSQVRVLTCC
jgi:hypothetical protein